MRRAVGGLGLRLRNDGRIAPFVAQPAPRDVFAQPEPDEREPARLANSPDKRKGGSMKLLAIIGIRGSTNTAARVVRPCAPQRTRGAQ